MFLSGVGQSSLIYFCWYYLLCHHSLLKSNCDQRADSNTSEGGYGGGGGSGGRGRDFSGVQKPPHQPKKGCNICYRHGQKSDDCRFYDTFVAEVKQAVGEKKIQLLEQQKLQLESFMTVLLSALLYQESYTPTSKGCVQG